MSPWRALWHLVRARPWVYLLAAVSWNAFLVGRLIPGLFERSFFDSLTGAAEAIASPWTLIALVVSAELARLLTSMGSAWADETFQISGATRFRSSLLARLLARPAATALSVPPGDAVSRFRDDVEDVALFSAEPILLAGTLGFGLTAIVLMLTINAGLTLIVVPPLMLV